MANFWLLIDTSHPSWKGIISGDCRNRHRRARPKNDLSATINNAGTQVLVKVTEGRPAWFNARPWKTAILRVFTEDDHHEAQDMMTTPDWASTDPGPSPA